MKLSVVSRKGKHLSDVEISSDAPVSKLKELFGKSMKSNWSVHRMYFTKGDGAEKIALKDSDKTLAQYGLRDGDILVFKDLGIQVGWRFVFFVEYLGPLLIHLFFFHFPQYVYGISHFRHSMLQTNAMSLVVLHYLKREFESVFVHRFSNATMPLTNIFKNSFHYWILGGVFMAYPLYHPDFVQYADDAVVYLCISMILLCMVGNMYCHLILMWLRPEGTTKRAIPRGFLFDYVSCPNYFLEITEWIAFSVMTCSIPSVIFAIVSAGQMWIWAVQKHKRYIKEFDGKNGTKYPKRKILIPFLL